MKITSPSVWKAPGTSICKINLINSKSKFLEKELYLAWKLRLSGRLNSLTSELARCQFLFQVDNNIFIRKVHYKRLLVGGLAMAIKNIYEKVLTKINRWTWGFVASF